MAPTLPEVGVRTRLGVTTKVAEALALLVPPLPVMVWLPFGASGTVKVIVAPPVAEVVPVLIGVAALSQVMLTVSPAP